MANQKVLIPARGTTVETRMMPIQSGATFGVGDFLVMSTTGAVIGAAAGNNYPAASSINTKIIGRAESPAVDVNTNSANPFVSITKAQPGTEFLLPLYHTTPASAVPTLSQLGTKYELRNTSGGWPAVDLTQTTNVIVKVVDFDPADYPAWPGSYATGSVQEANVWVEILASAATLTGAA